MQNLIIWCGVILHKAFRCHVCLRKFALSVVSEIWLSLRWRQSCSPNNQQWKLQWVQKLCFILKYDDSHSYLWHNIYRLLQNMFQHNVLDKVCYKSHFIILHLQIISETHVESSCDARTLCRQKANNTDKVTPQKFP